MPPDFIDIAKGEPDFDTPPHIKQAGCEAINTNFTKYTPQPGISELREAVADKFRRENKLDARPEEVVVSCGGKHSVEQTIRAILRPGDECIFFTPHWFAYPDQVKLAGATPVMVTVQESDGFSPRIENLAVAITPKTRLLIVNTPANPTGAVYSRELLERIAALAVEHDFYVLSDEVYERILFDGLEHVSIGSLNPEIARRTVTVNSVSKTHAMTGWRIGYAHLPGGLAERVTAIQQVSTSAPCAISQRAALAALTGDQRHVADMLRAYTARRAALIRWVEVIPGLSMRPPQGAFYAMINMSGVIGRDVGEHSITNADDLVRAAADAGLRVLSGAPFGVPNHLRVSFAVSVESINAGMERLAGLLEC